MNTREITATATAQNSNDYYVEMTHKTGTILSLTVAARNIKDAIDHLNNHYSSPVTRIELR